MRFDFEPTLQNDDDMMASVSEFYSASPKIKRWLSSKDGHPPKRQFYLDCYTGNVSGLLDNHPALMSDDALTQLTNGLIIALRNDSVNVAIMLIEHYYPSLAYLPLELANEEEDDDGDYGKYIRKISIFQALILSDEFLPALWPLFFENGKPNNIHAAICFIIKSLAQNPDLLSYLLQLPDQGVSVYDVVASREIGCLPNTRKFLAQQKKAKQLVMNHYLALLLYRRSHFTSGEFDSLYFNPELDSQVYPCHEHSLDLLTCLLNAGADPNHVIVATDNAGFTPMHVAAQNAWVKTFALMAKYGGKTDATPIGPSLTLLQILRRSSIAITKSWMEPEYSIRPYSVPREACPIWDLVSKKFIQPDEALPELGGYTPRLFVALYFTHNEYAQKALKNSNGFDPYTAAYYDRYQCAMSPLELTFYFVPEYPLTRCRRQLNLNLLGFILYCVEKFPVPNYLDILNYYLQRYVAYLPTIQTLSTTPTWINGKIFSDLLEPQVVYVLKLFLACGADLNQVKVNIINDPTLSPFTKSQCAKILQNPHLTDDSYLEVAAFYDIPLCPAPVPKQLTGRKRPAETNDESAKRSCTSSTFFDAPATNASPAVLSPSVATTSTLPLSGL